MARTFERRTGPPPAAIAHAYEARGVWLARLYRSPEMDQLEEAGRALVRLGNRLLHAGSVSKPGRLERRWGSIASAEVVLRADPEGGLTAEVGPLAPSHCAGAGKALVALGQRLRASASAVARGTGRFQLPLVPRPRPVRQRPANAADSVPDREEPARPEPTVLLDEAARDAVRRMQAFRALGSTEVGRGQGRARR